LAQYIETAEKEAILDQAHNLVLLRKEPGKTNHLFLIHDGTGEVGGYIKFCSLLKIRFNCWGLQADKIENLIPHKVSVRDIARKYIEKIKMIQPPGQGPYFIAGWSIGGPIAFEIVRQLEKEKEKVAFLGLIDSKAPSRWMWIGGLLGLPKFNLRSEWKSFKQVYFWENIKIGKKLKKIKKMEHFWPRVIDALESEDFKIDTLKRKITKYGRQVLPNFQRLNLQQAIHYFNQGRTLTAAANVYKPAGKIKAPVYYFKASSSWAMKEKHWKKYTSNPIKFNEIAGDHFTIFANPNVKDFAKIFSKILETRHDIAPSTGDE
jgi:thioesterase domain-containing protein